MDRTIFSEAAASQRAAWADDMAATTAAMQNESGGALTLLVLRQAERAMVNHEAATGDVEAMRLAMVIDQTVSGIAKAPRRRPMLCASCPRPVRARSIYAVVAVVPDVASPSNAVTLAICAKCGTTVDVIAAKALPALRKVWPDLCAFSVTHPEGGHA